MPAPVPVIEPVPRLTTSESTGPPPITDRELGRVWVPGFWIETLVRHGDAQSAERTVVVEQKAEGPLLASIDRLGTPDESALDEAPRTQLSWRDLIHATHIPRDRSRRVRAEMETDYGRQVGWLVEVDTQDTSRLESRWFFGDCCPGPALLIERFDPDGTAMTVRQLARADRSADGSYPPADSRWHSQATRPRAPRARASAPPP